MSGRSSGSSGSRGSGSRGSGGRGTGARPDKSTHAKSGKPRPGTGGYGRKKLEGKGPTPPAYLRPGHPAQRKDTTGSRSSSPDRDEAPRPVSSARAAGGARGSGDAAEMVAGRNSVVEALRATVPAIALYVEHRAPTDEKIREAVQLAAESGVPVREAGHAELARLTGGAVHQGVALSVRPYDYLLPDELTGWATTRGQLPLIVALDGVTDPRNLGAVIRSAVAFGAHGVILPERRAASVTATAWRTSAGTAARIPVAQVTNLVRALKDCQDNGYYVVGLDADGSTDLDDFEMATDPLVIVVGSEGRGLSRLVGATCDLTVSIPMSGDAESLNASVAAAVTLAEVARRRRVSRPL
jgi:23S rRNA (guanosine2251-2'-O)-methyltransferase